VGTTDLLMFTAIAAFVLLWGWSNTPWRRRALWATAFVACAAGVWSVVSFHWQAVPATVIAGGLLGALAVSKPGVRRFAFFRAHTQIRGPTQKTAVILGLITAGCAIPYYLYPMLELPAPDGSYPVGVRDFDVTRQVGTGATAPEARHLRVRVWYPAAQVETFPPRRYFTRDEAILKLPNFRLLHLYDVHTHGQVEAPVSPGGVRFPVVIFSHGYLLYPGQNTVLMEQLASHGYVVFSMSHPPDSARYRTLGGELVEESPWKPSEELIAALGPFIGAKTYEERYKGYEAFRRVIATDRLSRSTATWRDDNLFLTSALASATPPLAVADIASRIDLDRLAYAGMSFGGGAAASTCQVDSRCKAVVSLDGVTWDLSMFDTDLRAPLLLLQSDWLTHPLFPEEPHDPGVNPQDLAFERWEHAGERPDIFRYRMRDTAHLGMTDLVLIARPPVGAALYGEIDGRRAVAAINTFALSFLDVYLRSEKTDFPVSAETAFPEVIRHRASALRAWWLTR